MKNMRVRYLKLVLAQDISHYDAADVLTIPSRLGEDVSTLRQAAGMPFGQMMMVRSGRPTVCRLHSYMRLHTYMPLPVNGTCMHLQTSVEPPVVRIIQV